MSDRGSPGGRCGRTRAGREAYPPRPQLRLYVERGCPSCPAAVEVLQRVERAYPVVDAEVVDLGLSSGLRPPAVFAVPTFTLDGHVVFLGTPSWDEMTRALRQAGVMKEQL
jgi:hypothetical protein